jgi:diphosphomevalonate decarboxylase
MVKKADVLSLIFPGNQLKKANISPQSKGLAFAPTNIALCKYWGKRDRELNLPMTSSLSISLPDKGAMTEITLNTLQVDQITLNDGLLEAESAFVKKVVGFLNLFRQEQEWFLNINIKMNIPVAAGLASSACGFASLVSALNDFFKWKLNAKSLSILARLGSGSASRSLWNGFVEWHAGVQADGMDSFGEPLDFTWPELRIGILTLSTEKKAISSRDAMQHTVDTSVLYSAWPKKVARDMVILRQALQSKNLSLLGGASESNALTMHATMQSSWPPIVYSIPETLAAMLKVWKLREEGMAVYFTQDAGPNLKLLFLEKTESELKNQFSALEVIKLFE